jgi:hypothetical protein
VKRRVYIETTVISYLTAHPSRDLIRAAHQQITSEWWAERAAFELFASDAVLAEARMGDPDAAARRLAAIDGVTVLAATDDARELAEALLAASAMPAKAAVDCGSRRHRRSKRHGVPSHVELCPHRERVDAATDRGCLPRQGLRASDHLYA